MRPAIKPVTDPGLDAPDGAIVDGYERVGATWIDRLVRKSRWKRVAGPKRERGRIAIIEHVSGPPWNLVLYRYSSPLLHNGEFGYGHGRGQIVGRTNTTPMSETRFLGAFEPLPGPLAKEEP